MATPRYEYYTKMLETIIDNNDSHNVPFSSENLRQAVKRVMVETEEVETDTERRKNDVTMYTFFNHSIISPS